MTDNPSPTPRKRGGQPGNHNALTHGFYARSLITDPDQPITAIPPRRDDLDAEIAMIRLAIRSLITQAVDPQPLDIELALLRSLSFAISALNRLIKTHFVLGHSTQPFRKFTLTDFDNLRRELAAPISGSPDDAPTLVPRNMPSFYPPPEGDLCPLELYEVSASGLDLEIDLLRSFIRRVTLRQDEASGILESASILRAVSIALFNLAQLVRTNHTLQAAKKPIRQLEASLRELSLHTNPGKTSSFTLPTYIDPDAPPDLD